MVGMTMPREAKLACELEIPYVAVCISSNWAAGREPGDSSAALNHKMVSSTANDKLTGHVCMTLLCEAKEKTKTVRRGGYLEENPELSDKIQPFIELLKRNGIEEPSSLY